MFANRGARDSSVRASCSGRGYQARKVAGISLLVIVLGGLSACSLLRRGNGGATLGSNTALVGQATLVCSADCRARGQCGSSDNGDVVLMSSVGPATRGHDLVALSGTAVGIEQQIAQTVIQDGDGQQFQIPYYFVNVPGRGFAWVAGWCIAQ
jgi:hypothetical protein